MTPLSVACLFIRRIREWKVVANARRFQDVKESSAIDDERNDISGNPFHSANTGDSLYFPNAHDVVRKAEASDWWALRAQFRSEARIRLREREGLDKPIEITKDGRTGAATRKGKVKGPGAGLPIAAAVRQFARQPIEFKHVEIDQKGLMQELKDLGKHAETYMRSEGVRHADEHLIRYPQIEIPDRVLEDENALDALLQLQIEPNE